MCHHSDFLFVIINSCHNLVIWLSINDNKSFFIKHHLVAYNRSIRPKYSGKYTCTHWGYSAVRLVGHGSVSTTRTSRPNTKNHRKCCPSQATWVLPRFRRVKVLAASAVLVAASGVVCDSSLFSLEIFVNKTLLTSDGARANTSVSLINQVALVGQQHEAFGLQGRVVDVAHVGQAHPCHKSLTAE